MAGVNPAAGSDPAARSTVHDMNGATQEANGFAGGAVPANNEEARFGRTLSSGGPPASEFDELYSVGKALGKGSFAVVKEAIDRRTGEKFAVKIIDRNNPSFDGEALKKEIRIMQRIRHPNCIRLHGVYSDPQQIFLVLDLVTGGELFDRIIARGSYSEKDAAEVTREVLLAVSYLHHLGIIHRDLKPENLLYMSGEETAPDYNQIKIADFGLAKCVTPTTTVKTMCGTPGYVAPEVLDAQLAGPMGYGSQVDIWSIGVVVYIMLCGFPPFYSNNTPTLFRQIRNGDYGFPSPYWDNISDAAKSLVRAMLVVDPKHRLTVTQPVAYPGQPPAMVGSAQPAMFGSAQPAMFGSAQPYLRPAGSVAYVKPVTPYNAPQWTSVPNSPAVSRRPSGAFMGGPIGGLAPMGGFGPVPTMQPYGRPF